MSHSDICSKLTTFILHYEQDLCDTLVAIFLFLQWIIFAGGLSLSTLAGHGERGMEIYLCSPITGEEENV